jgi:hypothetical protein
MLDWLSKEFLIAAILSLVIALIVVSTVGPPYREPQAPGKQAREHSQINESEPKARPSPTAIQIECDPNCANKNSEQHGHESRLARLINKTIDDPIAIFTFFLGLATFFLVLAVLRQASDARVSSERQLRAYVFISSANVTSVAEGNGVMEAHVNIKNFGQTPAYKVINVNGLALDRYPPPPNLNLIISNEEFSAPGRSKSDLAPTQGEGCIEVARRGPLREEERRALSEGRLIIYVYGEIRYIDSFGGYPPWWATRRMRRRQRSNIEQQRQLGGSSDRMAAAGLRGLASSPRCPRGVKGTRGLSVRAAMKPAPHTPGYRFHRRTHFSNAS